MKKFASLLLTVVLLSTMLTVFAVPASAVAGETLTIKGGEQYFIDQEETYSSLEVYGSLVVIPGAVLTVEKLFIDQAGSLVLMSGATLKANTVEVCCPLLCIPSEVTIEVKENFNLPDEMILEPGAVLKAETLTGAGMMTVSAGATLISSHIKNDFTSMNDYLIDLYGTLKSVEGTPCTITPKQVKFNNGALLDLVFSDEMKANEFAGTLGVTAEEKRVYKHTHTFNCPCAVCGAEQNSDFSASVFSEGNLTIICTLAGLAVGFLAAMFIFKKKKPALAGGESKDEE